MRSGEEVFNSYGSLSNANLLKQYGFVEPNNPYDTVSLNVSLVLATAQQWCAQHGCLGTSADELAGRQQALRRRGRLPEKAFLLQKSDLFPEELRVVLQAFTLAPAEFAQWVEGDFSESAEMDKVPSLT